MSIELKKENIIDGAKQLKENGLSFHEYAELLEKIIISGQSLREIKYLLKMWGIDKIFEEDSNEPREN